MVQGVEAGNRWLWISQQSRLELIVVTKARSKACLVILISSMCKHDISLIGLYILHYKTLLQIKAWNGVAFLPCANII